MEYCIIGKFDSYKDGFIVVLSQIGRNYAVEIIEKGEKAGTSKIFNRLENAHRTFEKLVHWCVFGFYTTSQKKQFLITGIIE